VKIKNRQYSQAIGREDFFDHRKRAGNGASPEIGAAQYDTLAAVNAHELCESSGLTSRELERWVETGLLKA
jgi:hypothetical protein